MHVCQLYYNSTFLFKFGFNSWQFFYQCHVLYLILALEAWNAMVIIYSLQSMLKPTYFFTRTEEHWPLVRVGLSGLWVLRSRLHPRLHLRRHLLRFTRTAKMMVTLSAYVHFLISFKKKKKNSVLCNNNIDGNQLQIERFWSNALKSSSTNWNKIK
jgi:hypothetical protein